MYVYVIMYSILFVIDNIYIYIYIYIFIYIIYIIYIYVYKFVKNRNDKNNYAYVVKYITTYTSYYITRSQMAGIA